MRIATLLVKTPMVLEPLYRRAISILICLVSGGAFAESFLVLEKKAREVITYHCSSCHTLGESKVMTKPMKVFNLSDGSEWFNKMTATQLEHSKKRLIDRGSHTALELEEDFRGTENKPRKPTQSEIEIYTKFVKLAVQKKLTGLIFTE